ncbi:Pleckstrin y domain-containing G member 4B [Bulinus truncatus]|nr:Pleckstrin y domain-containing G member 4B [Bulinus truncatus]
MKRFSLPPESPRPEDGHAGDQCVVPSGAGKQLELPHTVADVDNELLWSGVAILPGCKDDEGRHLLYIFTCSSLWYERRVDSTHLARLLLYYYTIPRKRNSGEDWAVVADIRGASPSTVNILLEALCLFQASIHHSVAVVHLLADKTSQCHVIKSPLFDSKANVNLKIVLTLDHLLQYISIDQLPTVLEGTFPYHHAAWVRFRKKLEPFMSNCRLVACRLVDAMQQIASNEVLPQTVTQATEMIQAHESAVREIFQDETLLALQSDGPSIISSLTREEEFFSQSKDYSAAMEQAEDLHQHLQDCIARLARLEDSRMSKLHNCLQLREYEDECHKVNIILGRFGLIEVTSSWGEFGLIQVTSSRDSNSYAAACQYGSQPPFH